MSSKAHFLVLLTLIVRYCSSIKPEIHLNALPTMENTDSNKIATTILKVAPYPYLPDSVGDQFKSLLEFIKTQFETAYPNVTLQLRAMNTDDDFYDLSILSRWLTSNGSEYDIVEIDTALLGDLVSAGLIAPQFSIPDNHSDWISAAKDSVQFNGALYGYPHIMCASFLFTRDDRITTVTTIDQLIEVLGDTPTENYRLVGNLNSSWALPAAWIKSYQDSSNSESDMLAFALHAYQNSSFESVRKLARLCDRIERENHCLDGTFRKDPDRPIVLFAQGQAKAMFGYSEELFLVLKNGKPSDYNDIKIIPLPSGTIRNQPVFATDAYVFRRNMSNDVLNAARSFVEFMATPRMQAALVASGDSPYHDTIPRYLLSMSKAAYDEPVIANNRFYQQFFRNLTGYPGPNAGFLNTREQLATALLKYIM